MTFTPMLPDRASAADQSHPDVLALWWVGTEDSPWCEGFKRWVAAANSQTPSDLRWRIRFVQHDTLKLPRLVYRANEERTRGLGIIVWLVESHGIADLVRRIAVVQRTRSGYLHLTAGLVSPIEQRLLSEVGVKAHVQQPHQWSLQNGLIARWLG